MNGLRVVILSGLLAAMEVRANDAYLPSPQTGNLYPVASVQWAQDFWFGDAKATLPGHLTQVTTTLDGDYGIAPGVALDFSVGWSTVNYQGGPLGGIELTRDGQETRNGLTDTKVGVSWRIVDEFTSMVESTPTLTLRLGGIIKGTYDTGFANAVGDGASGIEAGLMFGKVLLPANAGLYGSFNYRWLGSPVPDEWEASLGAFKTVGAFTYSAGLRQKQAVDGIDILGPGFTLDRFPEVQEKNRTVEVGVTWQRGDSAFFSLGYAHTLDGENTPKKNVIVSAMSISL